VQAAVDREYPAVQAVGADAVVAVSGVVVRAESAWLRARDKDADDYGLWVAQLERQQAEWLVVGGYVGEWVSARRGRSSFAPDRGMARSILGRLSRSATTDRTFALEGLVRQNGDGIYVKAEYSQRLAGSWRFTVQTGVALGIPVLALGSSLAYFDAYRTERLPANLTQAQRDCFGAHTFRRIDRGGTFHAEWN